MTSKKELLKDLAAAQHDVRALEAEVQAHKQREGRVQLREHDAEQAKLREAERKARAQKLDHLAAGRLPLKDATQWAFVHEEGAKPGIEVFVPLDDQEEKALHNYFDAKDRVIPSGTTYFGAWLDEAYLPRGVHLLRGFDNTTVVKRPTVITGTNNFQF